MSSRTQNHTAW